MSNENETLIKEFGIFLIIASEKQALCYHILLFAVAHYDDQGNKNCITLHDVS